MTEQFRLDQGFRHCRAIERDKGSVPSQTEPVQAFRDQFLAGAAFADDEHRTIERRCPAGLFDRVEKGA